MKFGLLIGVAFLFASNAAVADTPPDPSAHKGHVASLLQGTKEYYPTRAAFNEKAGAVTVQCVVLDTGRLDDCTVLSEDPPGYGFGAATMKAVKDIYVVDLTKDKPGEKVFFDYKWELH